jgi:hypothetical protein
MSSGYQGVGTLAFRDATTTSVREKLNFPQPDAPESVGWRVD